MKHNKVRNLRRQAQLSKEWCGVIYGYIPERYWVRKVIKTKRARRWREHMENLAWALRLVRGGWPNTVETNPK